MRTSFFNIVWLLCSCTALGQYTPDVKGGTWNDTLKNFKTRKLNLGWLRPTADTGVINGIEVVDYRPDKINVGMYTSGFQKPEKLAFSDSMMLATVLEAKIGTKKEGGKKLLMIVNAFWITGTPPSYLQRPNSYKHDLYTSKAVCQADVFLEEGGTCFPLVKIDTILRSRQSVVNAGDDLAQDAIQCLNKELIAAIQSVDYTQRKKIEKAAIIHYYEGRQAAAAANLSPTKGIYRTYDQFKKQTTSNDAFAIRQMENDALMLYLVDQDGQEIATRDVWGVFDGTHHYIMDNGMLNRLYHDGDAFYWFGLMEYGYANKSIPLLIPMGGGWYTYGLEPVSLKTKLKLSPKLLDPRTGKAF